MAASPSSRSRVTLTTSTSWRRIPVPEAPGGPPGGAPPNLTAFNNAYLLPQNVVPAAPGEGQMYDVAPGEENANISPLDPFRRMHHMHVDGYLKGGLLGQMPEQQLGEPLPWNRATAWDGGTTRARGVSPRAARSSAACSASAATRGVISAGQPKSSESQRTLFTSR